MNKLQELFRKSTGGINLYIWLLFFILPFYFIYDKFSIMGFVFGVILILVFFTANLLSLIVKGRQIYVWFGIQIVLSVIMGLNFGFIYFSLFLSFFLGAVHNKVGFFVLYIINLLSTLGLSYISLVSDTTEFIGQLPLVMINVIAVILVPIQAHNKTRQDHLQVQLEDANRKISELVKLEERQRIARDLHDTLGQKLSLIGLKSELAYKLIESKPKQAEQEMLDVRQTARTALKEVRELVTQMRGTRLEDELFRARQILEVADVELHLSQNDDLHDVSLIAENVLGMCLKEAINNVIKHSEATACDIVIESSPTELRLTVKDNGVGINLKSKRYPGNGLRGMKERLEFVNGNLSIASDEGTTLRITVPNAVQRQL
ncbi:sensor histidine kinase [Paenibacillus dauci]|uniref:sensor histidine kinase n=1 Tax=Paenibacillus dauci TaxID=1567106 RepID=UPI0006199F84|nr:sensor histidine kinase [Paenibacillus dauci]